MEFNKQNKVIIDTMNTDEARAFIKFLESEIARHEMEIDNAIYLIHQVVNKFHIQGVLED